MNEIKVIYLAGKVPKSDSEIFNNWREEFITTLKKISEFEFIDPSENRQCEDDFFAVFGQDCNRVKNSDLIIINAREKLGVGTSQEMLIAKYFKKPVITILPKNTHHRRSNIFLTNTQIEDWIHPFISSTSDIIIEDFSEIGFALKELKKIEIKGIDVIDLGIDYFNKIKVDKND